jgi:hypothetical protein
LVRQGYTNREIAATLFVSVKAVEYHMGNIFSKLASAPDGSCETRVDEPVAPRSVPGLTCECRDGGREPPPMRACCSGMP